MDVTAPGTLTAAALADAVAAIEATVVFASPAALRNVVATAGASTADQRPRLDRVRLCCRPARRSRRRCCARSQRLLPGAELHTPYGMTEALPVTDITLAEIEARRRRATGSASAGRARRRGAGSARSTAPARPTATADRPSRT